MSGGRLLLVDDDPRATHFLRTVAEAAGHEVREINDPGEFERHYRDFEPVGIFLDVGMPEVDGLQILHWLGDLGSRAEITLISGRDSRQIDPAERLGASFGLRMTESLKKPIDVDLLRGHLAAHFSAHGAVAAGSEDLAAEILFEPVVDLTSGALAGLRALFDWQASEAADLAALEAVFGAFAGCRAAAPAFLLAPLPAALLSDLALPERVHELALAHHLPDDRIVLLVPTPPAGVEINAVVEVLSRLELKGINLCAGFPLFASGRLPSHRLPFSHGLLAGPTVAELAGNEAAGRVARHCHRLAADLGLSVLAAGVEDGATAQRLAELGCRQACGAYFGPAMAAEAVPGWLADRDDRAVAVAVAGAGGNSGRALSGRQREVLQRLAAGQSNKQIARDLRIGETTVKSHVKAIFAKLDVNNRSQATVAALRLGLVQ
ncbi:MAG: LuxR C-terminal-related transcriptional regulator [Alphaproteobacteria bacterium]|nr:LuxR C-terminal-related transcriptional regulator [Alphaproteobacteria bacterium]